MVGDTSYDGIKYSKNAESSNIFHKSTTIVMMTNAILSIGFLISVILWSFYGDEGVYKEWKSCLIVLAASHNAISKNFSLFLNYLDKHFCLDGTVRNKHKLLCAHSICCLLLLLVTIILFIVVGVELQISSVGKLSSTSSLLQLCDRIECKQAFGIMISGVISILTYLLESILHYQNHKRSTK